MKQAQDYLCVWHVSAYTAPTEPGYVSFEVLTKDMGKSRKKGGAGVPSPYVTEGKFDLLFFIALN